MDREGFSSAKDLLGSFCLVAEPVEVRAKGINL